MMKKNLVQVFWIYVIALLVFAFGFHGEAKEAKKAEATKKEDAKTQKKSEEKKAQEMIAHFETSKGNFKVKLFADKAPKTVENFVGLAEGTKEWTDPKTGKKEKKPYYDGIIFHRIIPNFMIQGGDPTGTGMGGPGFTINDEFHPDLRHNKAGILSMAKTNRPNTGGSQFFITVAPTRHLDDVHSVFGEVMPEDLETVLAISKVKTGPQDRPIEPVVIKHIKIERK